MRTRAALRLLVAATASWLLVYQVCDRYGDSFKAVAAQVLASREGPAVARTPAKDLDAWVPLVIGQTLVPGPRAPVMRSATLRPVAPVSVALAGEVLPARRDRSPPRGESLADAVAPRPLSGNPASLAPPLL
ncbi:MAG: hypothetical protein KGM24_06350 [Elusimicrobia bacterium]|nr:hypothetical protein [Elusimicrobiota bacterium]